MRTLDLTECKTYADARIDMVQNMKPVVDRLHNVVVNSISSFPTLFVWERYTCVEKHPQILFPERDGH